MNKGERNEKAREIAREKKLRERQAYILQFVGGQVPGGKRNLDRRIRDYLISEANYACTKCGPGNSRNGRASTRRCSESYVYCF